MRDENEMSDSAVSIHSIVTDRDDFNSDNEAPEDKVGQVDKIIKNHVLKEIIIPGSGLKKPSKHDFISLTYKSYFPSGEIIDDKYSEREHKDYLKKLNLPIGLIKSIERMRMGETAKITVRPKYAFKKINNEDIPKYFDDLPLNLDVISKIKSTPIIYEIKLNSFITFYDISGKGDMMKFIINQGDGVNKPEEGDEVLFDFTFIINDGIKIFEKIDVKNFLTKDNFSQEEMTIFKSMKKKEKSKIEILQSSFLFKSLLASNSNNGQLSYIRNNLSEHDINFLLTKFASNVENKVRIFCEIEMKKFKNKIKFTTYNNIDYSTKKISNGIGNVCPWKNSLVQLAFHLEINNKIFHSDFIPQEEFFPTNESEKLMTEFASKLKILKNKIQSNSNYLIDLQFIIDEEIKSGKLFLNADSILSIYDPLLQNLPKFITKEIIPSMKLLQVIKVSFTSKMDFLKILDIEIQNDDKEKNYVIYLCLINFQERASIFNRLNKKINSDLNIDYEEVVLNKILEYKTQANFFFSNGLLKKSKYINKFLIDDYIKFLNLLEKNSAENLTFNNTNFKEKTFSNEILEIIPTKIHEELRRIFSNLILILYRVKNFKKSEEYINHFLSIYAQTEFREKVLYFRYKILSEWKNSYQESKEVLEIMIDLYPNSCNIEEYKSEFEKIKNLISVTKTKKNIFMKKMFKFEKSDD